VEALVALGFANANLSKGMIQLQLEEIGAIKALAETVRRSSVPEEPFRAEIEAYDLPMGTEQTLTLNLDGRMRQIEVFVQADRPFSASLEGTVDGERWFLIGGLVSQDDQGYSMAHDVVSTSVRRVRMTVPAVAAGEGEEEGVMHILLIAT
jgi:hypothetical protein